MKLKFVLNFVFSLMLCDHEQKRKDKNKQAYSQHCKQTRIVETEAS